MRSTLSKIYTGFIFFIAVFTLQFGIVKADILVPGIITTCGELDVSAETYTLGNDIGDGISDCLTVLAGDITIDGAGFTIDGNILSSDGSSGSGGTNLNIINANVTGTIVSGDGDTEFDGGVGGSITISTSTVTTVTSGNGGPSNGAGMGGVGGAITIINATTTTIISGNGGAGGLGGVGGSVTLTDTIFAGITSGNGGDGFMNVGDGGPISITDDIIDLSSVTITLGSVGAGGGGHSGSLTMSYSDIVTNSSSFLYNVYNLIINSTSYGSWNGLFDPSDLDFFISDISQCSSFSFSGTYTFTQSLSGNCDINRDGVVINGAGYTLTGNVTSDPGINISLSNITVSGTIISGSGDSENLNGGSVTLNNSVVTTVVSGGGLTGTSNFPLIGGSNNNGGNGGNITISNSTTTDITTGNGGHGNNTAGGGGSVTISNSDVENIITGYGGDGGLGNDAGNGGFVTISYSTHDDITTGDGGNSENNAGNSGSVEISGSSIDFAGKSITAGTAGTGTGSDSGTLTLSYTGISTNTSTFFYNVSNLIINGNDYGAWNGVFNPTIFYFNDSVPGAGVSGDWADMANWWSNIGFTVPSLTVPGVSDTVFINTSLTLIGSGVASVSSAVFNDSSSNGITVAVADGAIFNSLSQNDGTITGAAVFRGDDSDNNGTVTGSVTRTYITDTTTIRDFTADGGRDDWIIIANNADVDISGATYDTANNIFKAINGGTFDYGVNVGGQVVPVIVVTSPVSGTTTIKWLPDIDWDTSSTCEYSYDNFSTTESVNCANDGSDIPKPPSYSSTLYLRGTQTDGSLSEKSVSFYYDNTVAIPTSCGSDLLDEVTRPYYYLTGNITANCNVRVNTELRGASTTDIVGYTLTGNVIADAISTTDGFDISLKNITITGTVSSNGGDGGATGYDGGDVAIATSTTGVITANGGDGNTTGGDGGNITVTNSSGVAPSTTISANGGNSLVCGYGGSGGSVTLLSSSYGTVTNNAGNDQTTVGSGLCIATPDNDSGGSSSSGSYSRLGQYTNPIVTPPTEIVPQVIPETIPAEINNDDRNKSSSSGSIINDSDTIETPVQEQENSEENILSESMGVTILSSIGISKESAEKIIKKTTEVVNSPTTKAVGITGVTIGFTTSISSYAAAAFSTPLAASELLLIPIRLWGLLLVTFGLKKKVTPWGTVYDSVTKQPIDPAYVTVTDANGNIVAESFTDIDGRYGFLLPDGTYSISAAKTNYSFPSKKLEGKDEDEMYNQLYMGGQVTVKAGEVINKNIPLDPIRFDWNEYEKNKINATVFYKKHDQFWRVAGNILFKFGTVVSIISVIFNPSTYNIIIISVYLAILVLSHFGIKGKQFGYITEKITGKPLSYAIFRVLSLDHETVLRSGVCDKDGRYYCIVPKGEYYLDIENKNPDGSYSKVYESEVLSGDSGFINKSFAV